MLGAMMASHAQLSAGELLNIINKDSILATFAPQWFRDNYYKAVVRSPNVRPSQIAAGSIRLRPHLVGRTGVVGRIRINRVNGRVTWLFAFYHAPHPVARGCPSLTALAQTTRALRCDAIYFGLNFGDVQPGALTQVRAPPCAKDNETSP
ncbi:unnamed protein product, partial [Iphiclides podalirius]